MLGGSGQSFPSAVGKAKEDSLLHLSCLSTQVQSQGSNPEDVILTHCDRRRPSEFGPHHFGCVATSVIFTRPMQNSSGFLPDPLGTGDT